MKQDNLENLLREVDRMAGPPDRIRVDVSAVRRRADRRHRVRLTCSVAAAAVLVIAAGIWYQPGDSPEQTNEQEKIIAIETQVKQLQTSMDAALSLIQEVLEDERQQTTLKALEAELASIPPDPLKEIRKQVDETAFILVYQADQLYRELNKTESAVETYKRVIRLFPGNQWAAVARGRLTEIEGRRI